MRSHASEWMDDFSIADERLADALRDLRRVNRWLGGHRASLAPLRAWSERVRPDRLRVLDVATGGADVPAVLSAWGLARGIDLHVTASDANPETLDYAQQMLRQREPAAVVRRITFEVADARALPYAENSFDIVHTALFMHHLNWDQIVQVLREMQRVARAGLIVNDLHRHLLAYAGIRLWAAVLPVSEMFAHDAPISVQRGFRRDELESMAAAAGLAPARLSWHWAFRWVLSTLPSPPNPHAQRDPS